MYSLLNSAGWRNYLSKIYIHFTKSEDVRMITPMPLLLRGATVIDGISRRPRANVAILTRNGRITAVGAPDEIGTPDGAEVLDLTGKWIIPGLIDMHCHIKDVSAPYFVAAGVTTVRNTAGWLKELADLRGAHADAPSPRVVTGGDSE
jgi:predicted amidohydrolase YtcJ